MKKSWIKFWITIVVKLSRMKTSRETRDCLLARHSLTAGMWRYSFGCHSSCGEVPNWRSKRIVRARHSIVYSRDVTSDTWEALAAVVSSSLNCCVIQWVANYHGWGEKRTKVKLTFANTIEFSIELILQKLMIQRMHVRNCLVCFQHFNKQFLLLVKEFEIWISKIFEIVQIPTLFHVYRFAQSTLSSRFISPASSSVPWMIVVENEWWLFSVNEKRAKWKRKREGSGFLIH